MLPELQFSSLSNQSTKWENLVITCHVFINVAESQFGYVCNAGVLHTEGERQQLLQDKVSATCGMVGFQNSSFLVFLTGRQNGRI